MSEDKDLEFNENVQQVDAAAYTDDSIRHLSDVEHIRLRPGMYIGKLGDGSQSDDGIYVLLKEVVDNCIDEFKMGFGKRIEIDIIENHSVVVRDYGRGIPQGMMIQAVSKLNTGAKYDDKVFQKSVGLNGVGLKAVNATSINFEVRSYRDGVVRIAKADIAPPMRKTQRDLAPGCGFPRLPDDRSRESPGPVLRR